MGVTRVVVHIDRLVLRGIEATDAAAVSAGIETQLRQLLGEPGRAVQIAVAGDRRRVKAGEVDTGKVNGARQLGRSAARQIVKGVTP